MRHLRKEEQSSFFRMQKYGVPWDLVCWNQKNENGTAGKECLYDNDDNLQKLRRSGSGETERLHFWGTASPGCLQRPLGGRSPAGMGTIRKPGRTDDGKSTMGMVL
ncbi:hypothetical protein B5E64_15260 [Drancourtella sp. An12]|nr:hypothetical protein B5E64_15260 [Drancourtella sp. An12]